MNISEVKPQEVAETFREAVPAHSLFKIQAFSLLSKNSIEKYDSNEFEAGGYKWSLSFYPDGNKTENGDGHVSLYLVLEDAHFLPAVSMVNVYFRLFLFNQIEEKYLIREDVVGRTSYFNEKQKVHGFPQFVSLAKFKDPSNGYLLDDTCVFGAEVFVSVTYTWTIDDFSKIKEESLSSGKFKAGDHNWDVSIYRCGNSTGKNNSMSLFLNLSDCVVNPGLSVLVDFKLRVLDQINGNHIEKSKVKHWFNAYSKDFGWQQFIGLSEMKDKEKGYLVNDTCIIETEVQVLEIKKVGDTFRKAVPAHFKFKIQAFSLLSMNSIEKYESNEFEAGGYKWSLSLYPDGNKAENGDGHVSLYLVLEDTNSLPAAWGLDVYFRLFLFDQIEEKYLICEDVVGKASYFNEMQKVHGFPLLVSLANFKDPSNGYLVDDTCVFGAEVFGLVTVTHTWRIENFSKILTKPRMETFTTQKLCTSIRSKKKKGKPTKSREEFSKMNEEKLYSEKFKAGDRDWDVLIYPAGVFTGKENSMSLFLHLANCIEKPSLKVCVNYKLRVLDQINGNHIEKSREKQWFVAYFSSSGWRQFIGLSEMNDKEKGFLVNDTCIVEAEVQVLDYLGSY